MTGRRCKVTLGGLLMLLDAAYNQLHNIFTTPQCYFWGLSAHAVPDFYLLPHTLALLSSPQKASNDIPHPLPDPHPQGHRA